MKLVVVGQAPGTDGDDSHPLTGRAGRRLADLAGVGWEEWLEKTERVNVLNYFPGKRGNGHDFPMDEARDGALRLGYHLNDRHVLLLGRGVARAFDVRRPFTLSWMLVYGPGFRFDAGILPHPSGVNPWYNDPGNGKRAGAFIRACLRRAGA